MPKAGRALSAGIELADLRVERATLEDVYLELTSGAVAAGPPCQPRGC